MSRGIDVCIKRIIISFIIIISGLAALDSRAYSLPETTIDHIAFTRFSPDIRLTLEAQIHDVAGIKEVRCYFKTGEDGKQLYVVMTKSKEGTYKCTLPALSSEVQVLEYSFLIVNGNQQVVRSEPYVVTEKHSSAAYQEESKTVSSVLPVYREFGSIEKYNTAIIDDQINLVTIQDVNKMYGLRAGLYEPTHLSEYLNGETGYFGGFIFDRTKREIFPVEGFAPNSERTFSTGMYPKDMATVLKSSALLDIEGTDWEGYFIEAGTSTKEPLTALITQQGSDVIIETTLTGLGHRLEGTINSGGDMLIYDNFDGEDWTTHYGPAKATLIKIYDYVMLPASWELNEIVLYRSPKPPAEVQAIDTTYLNNPITVSWNPSTDATSYDVYGCSNELINSCVLLSKVSGTQYDDVQTTVGTVYYRVKACGHSGCSDFSDYDTAVRRIVVEPFLRLLL